MSEDETTLYLEKFDPTKSYKGIKAFDCGEKVINDYLAQIKRQTARDNIYAMALVNAKDQLLGFFTATLFQLVKEKLPTDVWAYALPPTIIVMKIPMIGIDKKIQGQGWGKALMQAALCYCVESADRVPGIKGVYLDAKPGRETFYQRYSFEATGEVLPSGTTPMLLPMDRLRAAVAQGQTA